MQLCYAVAQAGYKIICSDPKTSVVTIAQKLGWDQAT